MKDRMTQLEQQLDSFDSSTRKEALTQLCQMAQTGQMEYESLKDDLNCHYHTFYSYNACGYSPSKIAWLARKQGLAAAGIVDFDVLDGLEEFYEACSLLGLKGSAGLETRVFVPEFADKEISSPGEPGIAYHMGVGFPVAAFEGKTQDFREALQKTADKRNRDLVQRVNDYLKPVELDYDQDVYPLTPAGNATERHICLAYAMKAQTVFSGEQELKKFWIEKLGPEAEKTEMPESGALQALIRAKTMKRGGIGYVQPDAGSFPKIAEMNAFVKDAGAIPTHTWLNGLSDGEQEIERLLETSMNSGAAALNIIPDRNYTPGKGLADIKCRNLYEVVVLADKYDLPIIVGTEMNSPGLKFVDDFNAPELKPLIPLFVKGALIVFAHSMLQRYCTKGYLSDWAKACFKNTSEKNNFFAQIGQLLKPDQLEVLQEMKADSQPDEIITLLS